MRILIAEDDQVLADGLLRSLRSAGYAVDHVGSGSEADAALAFQHLRQGGSRHPAGGATADDDDFPNGLQRHTANLSQRLRQKKRPPHLARGGQGGSA